MNILIIDDSPYIRNYLKKFFSEINGANVSGEAENAETAVQLIYDTNPDLIILDVELKNSSGFDVLNNVNGNETKRFPKPIVIMFTNHSSLYKEKALRLKADYFFDKTAEFEKLVNTVKSLIC